MSKALRILITGAAGGIGMATAQALACRGHSVVATDISALSRLEGIQAHALDVTSDDSVARCLKEVGPLDAIVNNAGIFGQGPVERYPLDPVGVARVATAGFRRHRECVECGRPSLRAPRSSIQRLQVRARSLYGVTERGSPPLWNTLRNNRARKHRTWHESGRAP